MAAPAPKRRNPPKRATRSDRENQSGRIGERNLGGRPTKLEPKIMGELERVLRLGVYRETAAIHAGISKVTFYNWINRGNRDRKSGKDNDFTRFVNVVEKAEASAYVGAIAVVRSGRANWQSNAWFLERKAPDQWGRAERAREADPSKAPPIAVIYAPVRSASADEWAQHFRPTPESDLEAEEAEE